MTGRLYLSQLAVHGHHCNMAQKINRNNTLSRAYWCGAFCCSEKELIEAMDTMASDEAGVVGLFLATRKRSTIAHSEEGLRCVKYPV